MLDQYAYEYYWNTLPVSVSMLNAPCVFQVIDRSTSLGVESFVMGMPHRGRLNVLSNVCRKPLEHIFSQFAGLDTGDEVRGVLILDCIFC